jgi:hypothetical protein
MKRIHVDSELIRRALAVSHERTPEAVVTKALEEFVALRSQRRLLDLMGKLEWDPSLAGTEYRIEEM